MKKIPITRIDILIHFTFAMVISLVWFLPSIPTLGKTQSTWLLQMWDSFFTTSQPEILIGETVDVHGSFWMIHNMKEMVLLQNDSFLEGIYYPTGFDLGMNTGFAWMDTLTAIPLAIFMDAPGYYNLHVYIICTLSLFSISYLCRSFGLPHSICFSLGILGFFNSFTFYELNSGRPTQISWWPFCLVIGLAVKQQCYGFTLKDGIKLGFAFTACCLTYWFSSAALGATLVITFTFILFQHKSSNAIKSAFISVSVTLFWIFLITFRVSVPILLGKGQNQYSQVVTPNFEPLHVLGFKIQVNTTLEVQSLEDVYTMLEMSHYHYPLMILAFVCILIPYDWKTKYPWVIGLGFVIGVPVASIIQIDSWRIPTGLLVLETIFPPMIRCQFWYRMMVVGNLISITIVAFTLQSFTTRHNIMKNYWLQGLLSILFVSLSDITMPFQENVYTTSFTSRLSSASIIKSHPGAIIEIPTYEVNENYVQQIFHEQPIFWGPGADTVRPPEHKQYHENSRVIFNLNRLATGATTVSLSQEDLRSLYSDGFRWVIFNSNHVQTTKEHLEWTLFSKVIEVPEDGVWLFKLKDFSQ